MKHFLAILFFFLITPLSFGYDLSGTWQGVVTYAGQSLEQSSLLYIFIDGSEGEVKGLMREEKFNTDLFAVKQTKFDIGNDELKFQQIVVSRNRKTSSVKWCRLLGDLKYDSIKGYLSGSFSSSDCKRVVGKIILYKSDFTLKDEDIFDVSQIWFKPFVKDYNDGLSAPKIRELERKNFKFEPVFFDYDQAIIRDEHKAYLDRLIKVVKGHSDLRVLVIGHTDSDGSDSYNDELSKRRAEAIISYFVAKGLSADRLEFDFEGERNPVGNNATPDGKQLNRRVDFKFI